MRLDDEDVGAPDVLAEATVDLTVREVTDVGLAQRYTEMTSDVLGQGRVRTTRVQPHRLLGDQLHSAKRPPYELASSALAV